MKTIITIAVTLVFAFANGAFAFDPNYGENPNNNTKQITFGINYSGNPYYGNPYPHNPGYGNPYPGNYPNNPHYGHPNCGGNHPHNPYYGNQYPGNYYPNNPNNGNQYPGNYYPNNPNNGNQYQGNYYPNNPNNGNPYTGNHFVNENSFNGFINALNNEAFDNNKLKMAQFYASSVVLTVQQIGRILQEFTFDSNRLKFAKDAYANCYDKYNYVILRNNFDFSSNFERLMDDISH